MSVGILIIAAALFIAVFVYRKPSFERKLLRQIPLTYWVNLVIVPVLLYVGLSIIILSIISRPRQNIFGGNDTYLLISIIFFTMCAYVGQAIHLVSKILWHYLVYDKHHQAYKVNEFFHGKFSHYLIFGSSMVVMLGITLLELNYPTPKALNKTQFFIIILGALIFGASSIKGFRHAQENYYRKLTYVCMISLSLNVAIIYFLNINLRYYQFYTFLTYYLISITLIYLARPLIIRSKLDRKHRLRHIINALSIHDNNYHRNDA